MSHAGDWRPAIVSPEDDDDVSVETFTPYMANGETVATYPEDAAGRGGTGYASKNVLAPQPDIVPEPARHQQAQVQAHSIALPEIEANPPSRDPNECIIIDPRGDLYLVVGKHYQGDDEGDWNNIIVKDDVDEDEGNSNPYNATFEDDGGDNDDNNGDSEPSPDALGGVGSEPAHPLARKFLVCSRTLARTSSICSRALYGSPGVPALKPRPADPGAPWVVSLPRSKPSALRDVLEILHGTMPPNSLISKCNNGRAIRDGYAILRVATHWDCAAQIGCALHFLVYGVSLHPEPAPVRLPLEVDRVVMKKVVLACDAGRPLQFRTCVAMLINSCYLHSRRPKMLMVRYGKGEADLPVRFLPTNLGDVVAEARKATIRAIWNELLAHRQCMHASEICSLVCFGMAAQILGLSIESENTVNPDLWPNCPDTIYQLLQRMDDRSATMQFAMQMGHDGCDPRRAFARVRDACLQEQGWAIVQLRRFAKIQKSVPNDAEPKLWDEDIEEKLSCLLL